MSTPQINPIEGLGGVEECALLYNDDDQYSLIGGQRIGYPARHRMQFYWSHTPNQRPAIGVHIWFPRAMDAPATFFNDQREPTSMLKIGLKLLVGTWTSMAEEMSDEMAVALPTRAPSGMSRMAVVRVQLNDGQKPVVEGLGLPFVARDAKDDMVVNCGEAIDGVRTLRQICSQSEFVFLFQGTNMIPKGNAQFADVLPTPAHAIFPYSPNPWSMPLYRDEVPKYAQSEAYAVSYQFDNAEDYFVSVSQGVVQDIFHLANDIYAIRCKDVRCMFIKASNEPIETAKQFTVLVWHGFQEGGRCAEALPTLKNRPSRLALAFELPPDDGRGEEHDWRLGHMSWEAFLLPDDKWTHTGCDFAMSIRRPRSGAARSAKPGVKHSVDHNVTITVHESFEEGRVAGSRSLVASTGEKLKCYLKFDPGLRPAKRRVDAAYQSLLCDGHGDTSERARHLHCGLGFQTLLDESAPV